MVDFIHMSYSTPMKKIKNLTGRYYQIVSWLNESVEKTIELTDVKKIEIALLGRTNETLEMILDVLTITHRLQYKLRYKILY